MQKIAVFLGALVLICLLLSLFVVHQFPALALYDEHGKLLKKFPLPDGTFIHHYIHSIHKTPVDEFFTVANGELLLTQVRYDSYGVGMPTDEGDSFTLEDGRFIVNLRRTFTQIDLRVSPVPDHGIMIEDTLYRFADFAAIEDLLVLRPSVSYLLRLGRKSLP